VQRPIRAVQRDLSLASQRLGAFHCVSLDGSAANALRARRCRKDFLPIGFHVDHGPIVYRCSVRGQRPIVRRGISDRRHTPGRAARQRCANGGKQGECRQHAAAAAANRCHGRSFNLQSAPGTPRSSAGVVRGQALYCPGLFLTAASICCFTASRLKDAGSCIGG